jgi:Flp pilus assembly protein CpaB
VKTKQKQTIFALIVSVVVILLVQWYIDYSVEEQTKLLKRTVPVVVASQVLKPGTPLTQRNIKFVRVPVAFAPKARITQDEFQQYLGQPVAVNIQSDDYILKSYFTEISIVGDTLSEQIGAENLRAITIPVDETNSFARSIVTGDRIDLLLSFHVPQLPQKISVVMLQDVEVIATGSYSAVDQELGVAVGQRYSTITLRLPVQDAVRLDYARQVGSISILLRYKKDNNQLEFSPLMSVADLLSASAKEEIQELVHQASLARLPDDEQLRKQLQDIFEKQRKQSGSGN